MREVLTVLDGAGASTYREVWCHMDNIQILDVRRYCERAVRFGLAEVLSPKKPRTYISVANWRERIILDKSPAVIERSLAVIKKSPIKVQWIAPHNPFNLVPCFFAQQGDADRKQLEKST